MGFKGGVQSENQSGASAVDPDIKNRWMQFEGRADDAYRTIEDGYKSGRTNIDPASMVAPLSQDQLDGQAMAKGQAFQGLDWLGQAKEGAQDVMNGGAMMIQPQRAAGNTSQSNTEVRGVAPVHASIMSAPTMGATQQLDPGRFSQIKAAEIGDMGAVHGGRVDFSNVPTLAAGSLPGTNLKSYTNPFQDQVVNRALDDIDLTRRRQINQNSSDFSQRGEGAWRGSRAGVADALTNEAAQRQSADTAAQLRQAGYANAQQAAQSDLDRSLQAGQANLSSRTSLVGQQAGLDQQSGELAYQTEAARRQANAGFQQQAGITGAANALAAAQGNQNVDLQRLLTQYGGQLTTTGRNQDALNTTSQFNAQQDRARNEQQANLDFGQTRANQDAQNQLDMFNAGQWLDAQRANQGADLQAQGLNLSASQALAAQAAQRQQMGLAGAGAYSQAGAEQRAAAQQLADANTQEALRRQSLPDQAVRTLSTAYGFYPTTQSGGSTTQHSSGKSGGVG